MKNDIQLSPPKYLYPLGEDSDTKYVKVQFAQAHEYKEGDIVSMHGFDMTDDADYEVVSSKQLNRSTVELKVKRKDKSNE